MSKNYLVVLCIICGLCQALQAQPKGRIVYSTTKDGNQEIYVFDLTANQNTRLTQNSADDGYPRWRADGRQIAFTSFRTGKWQTYLMNSDGSGQVQLSLAINFEGLGYPDWSPDGKTLALAGNLSASEKAGIYLVNIGAAQPRQLTGNNTENVHPAWSPDGKKIAFASDRDGNREIYVVDVQSNYLTNLTKNASYDDYPSWSPDGTRLAFASARDNGGTSDRLDIYTMHIDGTNIRRITDSLTDERHPVFSPDGNYIAFVSGTEHSHHLVVGHADGTQLKSLTSFGDVSHPHWIAPSAIPPLSPTPKPVPVPTPNLPEIPTLFLLDISDSMNEHSKIEQARAAALGALSEIKDNQRLGRASSVVAVWVFSGDCVPQSARQVLPFTNNLAQADVALRSKIPRPKGNTPLPQAVSQAIQQIESYLQTHPALTEGRIVLLSDGQSTCGALRPANVYSQAKVISIKKIKCYTIGFEVPPGSDAERDLQYLATASGGQYFPARDRQQLLRVFPRAIRSYQPHPATTSADAEAGRCGYVITSGDFTRARTICGAYVRNNPGNAIGYYNLAVASEGAGLYRSAAENYRQYLQTNSSVPDRRQVEARISQLEQESREQRLYILDLLRSDLAYLIRYYHSLFTLRNEALAAEFSGFVAEKQEFYEHLTERLEINSSRLESEAKALTFSLRLLNQRAGLDSFDRDAVSLLTIPIGQLEELIEDLVAELSH